MENNCTGYFFSGKKKLNSFPDMVPSNRNVSASFLISVSVNPWLSSSLADSSMSRKSKLFFLGCASWKNNYCTVYFRNRWRNFRAPNPNDKKKKIKLNRITLYLCCVHDHDCMVVGFTTTYEISTYHHWCCEFESQSGWDVQHYVLKFVNDLRQVGGFLWVLHFPPPIKLTATI